VVASSKASFKRKMPNVSPGPFFKIEKMGFDVTKHVLVPKHTKLSEKEKEALFAKYNITFRELPKILKNDPAIAHLNPKPGDVIKIERKSKTAGKAIYYRGVVG